MSNTTIANYESGYSTPDVAILKKLAKIFDVTTDYLLGNTDKQKTIQEDSNYNDITLWAHRTGHGELSEEAQQQLIEYVEFLKQKYKKNK